MKPNKYAKTINNNYAALRRELSKELEKLPYASRERLFRLLKHIYIAGLCEERDVSAINPFYDYTCDRIKPECDVLALAKNVARI